MPKKLIAADALGAGMMNRGPADLGPGVLRLDAKEENEADVFIYGDIGGWWGGVTAEQFAKDVAELKVDTLNVRLNSPGGIVFEGVAIYNALARHSANVIVHVEGIAASIASIIAMAGDEVRIAEGSRFMIHDPWSIVMGSAADLRAEADVLEGLKSDLIDIYAARTEQSRDDLAAWMTAETWLSARDAVDKGFADSMTPAKKKEKKDAHARSAMLSRFRNAPQDVIDPSEAPADIREFERLLRDEAGFTHAQAKRIAVLARVMNTGPRDGSRTQAPRDDGASARRLAAFLRSL